MAEGYLVAELDDESGDPIGFWNGTQLIEDMQTSVLYPDRTSARLVLGSIQSMYPEKEMSLRPAAQVVELRASVNVPSGNPQAVAVAMPAAAVPPADTPDDDDK
jgi:hypothetical protein